MRLIDADALLEQLSKKDSEVHIGLVMQLIDSMPTVQREEQDNLAGWVSVPIEPNSEQINTGANELRQAIAMFNSGRSVQSAAIRTYKAMLQAAPTDKE